jgi:hypothetical protein
MGEPNHVQGTGKIPCQNEALVSSLAAVPPTQADAPGESFCFSKMMANLPACLCGSQGNPFRVCISRRFWRREFSRPLESGRIFSLAPSSQGLDGILFIPPKTGGAREPRD